ncbi:MAG: DUF2141 domain-containing protein [Sphingomonas sp.]
MRAIVNSLVRRGAAATAVALLAAAPASGGPRAPAPPAQQGCTGPESPVRLYVNVSGVRAAQGLLAVTLYADIRSKFLVKKGSMYTGRVPASAPSARICIHVPRTGYYAIAMYHDADSSLKLNRSGLGLPAEGFGFSNNAPTLFGLPSFDKVRFNVPRDGAEISIKMKYP